MMKNEIHIRLTADKRGGEELAGTYRCHTRYGEKSNGYLRIKFDEKALIK